MTTQHSQFSDDVVTHAEYLADNTPFTTDQALVFANAMFKNGPTNAYTDDEREQLWKEISETLRQASTLLQHIPAINPSWQNQALKEIATTYYGTDASGEGDDIEHLILHENQHPAPTNEFSKQYYLTHKLGEWAEPHHTLTIERHKYDSKQAVVDDVLNEPEHHTHHEEVKRYAFLKEAGFDDALPDVHALAANWDKWGTLTAVKEQIIRTKDAADLLDTTQEYITERIHSHDTEPHQNHITHN